MDEEHIILLLAVIAVLILAVAVVILLPKETGGSSKADEEKQRKRRGNKKPKETIQLGNVKAKSIKGFDDIEDAEDKEKMLAFLSGMKYELNTIAKKDSTKNQVPDAAEVPEGEEEEEAVEQDERFTMITKKKKTEGYKEDQKPKSERRKGKKKGPFFKPEIIQEMREGRKKDRDERQKQDPEQTEEKPRKKREQKPEEQKDQQPTEQQQQEQKKEKKHEGQQDKKEQKPKYRAPKDADRPNRIPGVGRGTRLPMGPPPIRNTGLEAASLDDMLNAITSFYPANIFQQRFSDPKILIRILSFLPLKNIIALSFVDRFFHGFIKREEQVWRNLCRRDFGLNNKLPNSKSFKHTYKVSYKGQ